MTIEKPHQDGQKMAVVSYLIVIEVLFTALY